MNKHAVDQIGHIHRLKYQMKPKKRRDVLKNGSRIFTMCEKIELSDGFAL